MREPLVGREEEIAALREALAAPGGMVLVSGEGGIGKSRLVAEAAALAESDGRAVVWARPEQITRPGAFALVLDLVENIAAQAGAAVAADAASLAEQLLEPTTASAAGHAARRVAARLRGLLAATGPSPVAVFEDLHSADEASHAVIVHLARSAADDGRLIVGTYRTEALGAADELERFLEVVGRERLADEIRLGPLRREDSAALAGRIVGDAATEGQVDWIAAASDGIPFFVEELSSAYLASGSLAGVPDSIARAVLARAQRLGAVARQVVHAAALSSGAIDPAVLALALDLDSSTVTRALAEAARAGIVEDRDDRLMFRHNLVREAIAADMVSVEAQELHRRIATAIEQVHAASLGPHAKALARHWYEGREASRALRYAIEAGDRALALAATHEARLAYELAVACTDTASPEALVGLAEVDIREGRTQSAELLFRRAADELLAAGREPEAARALSRLAWTHAVERRFDASFDALDRALDFLDAARHPALRALLLAQKGRMFRGGRPAERVTALREAAEIADRLGENGTRADALEGLAWDAYLGFRADEAVALAEQSCAAALEAGAAEPIGRCHNNCALIHSGCGDPLRGIELLSVARDLLSRSFGSVGVAFIDSTEALMRFRMGEPNQVARLVARIDVGWTHSRGMVRMLQAWTAMHAGEVERARGVVALARREIGEEPAGEAPVPLHVGSVEVVFAEMLVRLEAGDSGLSATAEALVAFDWSQAAPDDEALALILAGRGFAAAGRHPEAVSVLERLESFASRFRARTVLAAVAELRAAAVAATGDHAAAAASYRDAAREYAAYPNVIDRARCVRLAADASADANAGDVVESLKEARMLAVEAGSQVEAARIEASLRARGVRPRAGRPRKAAGDRTLSPREEEIAALVAAGATNAEIAGRLFLSERTVQDHVTHATRKAGVAGRAGLAAWAAKRGLV